MKSINKKIKFFVVLGTAFCLAGLNAFADEKGTEIIQKARDLKKPKFSESIVEMTLVDKSGTKEVRQIHEFGRNSDGLTDAVMIFMSPANVKDTRFLLKENKNRADDKWIYLPALKNTRRVNSSEGSKSFMGTDATYDDLSTREVSEDEHQYLGDEKKNVGGTEFDCYKVKEIPVDAKASQYKFRITWVDKATYIPVYTELYDKNEKLLKILTVPSIKNESGYTITYESKLENVQTGHSTSIKILKLALDKPLPDRVFTSNFLNTGK